jgi:hypothetical protein
VRDGDGHGAQAAARPTYLSRRERAAVAVRENVCCWAGQLRYRGRDVPLTAVLAR